MHGSSFLCFLLTYICFDAKEVYRNKIRFTFHFLDYDVLSTCRMPGMYEQAITTQSGLPRFWTEP